MGCALRISGFASRKDRSKRFELNTITFREVGEDILASDEVAGWVEFAMCWRVLYLKMCSDMTD